MGEINQPRPVLLIVAAFSRHEAALDWARATTAAAWGDIALESERFEFSDTDFYERAMGANLRKTFFAFERLIDPAELPGAKHQSNAWEEEYAGTDSHDEPRPLNLDPGYVSEAKLVLATTKDRDHRLYLDRGIYAEGTLYFHARQWCTRPWTYPDYQRADYQTFFTQCRDYLRQRYRA